MKDQTTSIGRRQFLAAGAILPTIVSASSLGLAAAPAPSDRINVGVIGLGSRGFNLIDELLRQRDARITKVCDVDRIHHRDREWGQGPTFGIEGARKKIDAAYGSGDQVAVTSDFRELCRDSDLNAIVVATPDHWHAFCTIEALRNGKDVYCEKPVTHTFHEGQLVYREVASRKAVFQTGSQQRSDAGFRRAVQLVRNGHLGKIKHVEVGLPAGYDKPQGDTTVMEPPEHLDYEMWTGPAPELPYMRARHHRWWRGHRAYGGGVLMDWIGHHNDIAHWALGMDDGGPVEVEAVGWTFPETDVYNTPQDYEIRCRYNNGTTSSIGNRHTVGAKFIGDDGWVFVTRGRLQASNPIWTKAPFPIGDVEVYESDNHMRNFLDCVRTRKECIAPAETAHRSITPGHLGYVSQTLGRPIRWDAKTERARDDEEANRLLQTDDSRAPWSLQLASR